MRDLAEALDGLADDLERQQRARRQLAQDLSHELRTPLMLLQGRIEAMQDGVVPFDAEGLATLHTETLRLGRLVGQIERLAEAEAHPPPLRRRMSRSTTSRARPTRRSRPRSRCGASPSTLDVRPAAALADHDAVRQIATNLLTNALKYAPEGRPVRLSTGIHGRHAVLSVHDAGGDHAGADRSRVFERFYRGPDAAWRSGGEGLGLTIAHELAEAQGGTLELKRARGHVVRPEGSRPHHRRWTGR